MTAKKPIQLDACRTQVFQSPHTGAFFALDQDASFEHHLRQHVTNQKKRDSAADRKEARLAVWAQLRQQTSSVRDLEQRLKDLPADVVHHYKKLLLGQRAKTSNLSMAFSEQGKRSYGMRGATHHSPLGEDSNWGGWDKTRASSRLGLKIPAAESPNELMRMAEKESGLHPERDGYVLFAKDWPFVAKQILWEVLQGKIRSAPTLLTGEPNQNHPQFLADVEHASVQCTGMPYAMLKSMVESLEIDVHGFNHMAAQYKAPSLPDAPPTFGLPTDILDEPNL